MRVNLINSFYTSVFLKKTNVKKINTLKKKKKGISREQCNSHCSHAQLFSEQWRHDTLFHEQCIMLHCLNSVAWLFSKSRAKKQHFSAFKLPAFHTQFIVGPIHSEQLFFLNQTLSQCVFEETQPLPLCQTSS
jgi:Na+/glutamate symporter